MLFFLWMVHVVICKGSARMDFCFFFFPQSWQVEPAASSSRVRWWIEFICLLIMIWVNPLCAAVMWFAWRILYSSYPFSQVASCKIHGAWVLALHLVDVGSQIDIVSFNATAAVLDQWSREARKFMSQPRGPPFQGSDFDVWFVLMCWKKKIYIYTCVNCWTPKQK